MIEINFKRIKYIFNLNKYYILIWFYFQNVKITKIIANVACIYLIICVTHYYLIVVGWHDMPLSSNNKSYLKKIMLS